MGIFDRKNSVKNSVQINEIDRATRQLYFSDMKKCFSFDWGNSGKRDFARMFIYIIYNRIFAGLRNITWKISEVNYTAADIVNFVENNADIMLHHYYHDGYIAVIINQKTGIIRLPFANELKTNNNGEIVNKDAVVIYSQPYQIDGRTHWSLVKPFYDSINTDANNADFISNNLGAMGIISSNGIPMSPADKNELNQKLQKDYGLGNDKFQFILSNAEMKYTPINLNASELKLSEKVMEKVKYICNFFNINPDLIFGGSTFANQEEATKNFYYNCIIPLAEVLLSVARNLYIKLNVDGIRPSTIITYNFTNVPELNKSLSTQCGELTAYIDYLLKLKEAGVDVDEDINKVYEANRDMLANV